MFLEFLRLDGEAFHAVGPAWEKSVSLKVFRVYDRNSLFGLWNLQESMIWKQ